MDKVRTAWREDRRQFVIIFIFLALGVVVLVRNHNPVAWTALVFFSVGAIWQSYDVFVSRPRRLERTGQRSKPGRWNS